MPQPAINLDLDELITFRVSAKQRKAVEVCAKSIEAPRSYALRRLLAKALETTEQSAA